jgi:hypothetical protein
MPGGKLWGLMQADFNKRFFMSDITSTPTVSETGPVGIGGWLIFPAAALLFSPLFMAYQIFQSYVPIFKPGVLGALLNPASSIFSPTVVALLAWGLIVNVALLCFTVWLAVCFYKKQMRVPRFYIIWLFVSFGLQMMDIILVSLIPEAGNLSDPEFFKGLAKSVLALVIWVPYFLKSKRVENTFIH